MKEPLVIRIKPRPSPRPRLGKHGAYNPSWYTAYKKELVGVIKGANIPKKEYSELYVVFGLPYPKNVIGGKKEKIEAKPNVSGSGDLDNFIKGIKDAITQAQIINDDCQIYIERSCKVWTNTEGYIKFILI